jgi:hypothetical protein
VTDIAYYQRRLSEELAAIGRSNCPKAAAAHRELAEIYRILIDGDGQKETENAPASWPDGTTRGELDLLEPEQSKSVRN